MLTAPIDENRKVAFLLMRDMVLDGSHFCSATEPFSLTRVTQILEQLAQLHAAHTVLGSVQNLDWVGRNMDWLAELVSAERIQGLMAGPRSAVLVGRTGDAQLVIKGLKALATIDRDRPFCLVHGDTHGNNIFESAEGAGLMDWQMLQRGGWALDVAYHIASVLPVEVAEREERGLLAHYLDTARSLGAPVPDDETAWLEYRQSLAYGYFLWAITATVDPAVIMETVKRMAHAVDRHDTYRLLGV